MFKTILLILDGSAADQAIVQCIKPLADTTQGRVVLLQVDGPAARAGSQGESGRRDAVDLEHLRKIHREFQSAGISVELELACGEPVSEIVKQAREKDCDLVVLCRRRRHSLTDLIFGTLASRVQDSITLPVLLLRAEQSALAPASAEQ